MPLLEALALNMKNTDEFLEDRIRWRAKQHGIPKQRTLFWEEVLEIPSIILSPELGDPVLFSSSGKEDFIVLCTRGAAVKNEGVDSSFIYSDIHEIRDVPPDMPRKIKAELYQLVVVLNDGNHVKISPEPHGPASSIWNILLMLQRMS